MSDAQKSNAKRTMARTWERGKETLTIVGEESGLTISISDKDSTRSWYVQMAHEANEVSHAIEEAALLMEVL